MMFRNPRFIIGILATVAFCTIAYFGLASTTGAFAASVGTTTPRTAIAQQPAPGTTNQPNQTNQCNPTNQANQPNQTNQANQPNPTNQANQPNQPNQCNPTNQTNPAPTNVCPPTISEGAQGSAVQTLQTKLNIPVTGAFDAQTLAAVKQFQAQHNLPVDGVVGASTWHALGVC
jgi:peptidoglycan hydrolase-like protein with peptidoglycan-binding domain